MKEEFPRTGARALRAETKCKKETAFMERLVGTVSRGIRAPIIRQGDDLASIVVDSVLSAANSEGFCLRDRT